MSVRVVEQQNTGRVKVKRYYDYSLLFLIVFLVGFGLIMIYSTSSYNAMKYYNDPMLYFRKQGIYALIGIPLMIVVSKIDYRLYIKRFAFVKPVWLLYLFCIGLQVIVLFVGDAKNGSQRWIQLGGFSFQPSELSKICVLLFVAYVVQLAPSSLDHFWGFLRVVIYTSILIGLVVIENFSTALVLLANEMDIRR